MSELERLELDLRPIEALTRLLEAAQPLPVEVQKSVGTFLAHYTQPAFLVTQGVPKDPLSMNPRKSQ